VFPLGPLPFVQINRADLRVSKGNLLCMSLAMSIGGEPPDILNGTHRKRTESDRACMPPREPTAGDPGRHLRPSFIRACTP